jgi:hypothetical protein
MYIYNITSVLLFASTVAKKGRSYIEDVGAEEGKQDHQSAACNRFDFSPKYTSSAE